MKARTGGSCLLRRIVAGLLLSGAVPAFAQAPSGFTVGDIRVEGLQRISEGTVYNYLPVNIGDRLDQRRIQEAIRALFGTGFFSDIEMRRDGETLVVVVHERPSIESFELSGNKDIKTEDLQQSLRGVGLAAGKTFDRSVLEEVRSFLTDQYFSRGKYAVRIDPKVEDVPGNKVRIKIEIVEGQRARIRQINLVGNTAYEDEELLDAFELQTPNWLSWYRQDDRYSRESLQGDIEKLTSWYQDRGYANFEVESTQVAIAPEMDDIFITMNMHEGEVYKVGEVKLAGTMKVPESELQRLLMVAQGQTYSRKLITQTQELMSFRLGADGYAFAKIDPVPTAHEDTKTIDLTFFVDPGNRAYVRRVNFVNTSAIDDTVLRREMRQMEGSYLSNALLERSKERIQRLPYIENVDFETTPVPGTPDLVDVDFDIKEGLPGQFSGGIGYSEAQAFMINGSFVHSNFMGSGERVALDLVTGKYSQQYSISHTDSYTTINNVTRTLGVQYRDVTQFVSAASDFSTTTMSGTMEWGYPISEYQGLRFGVVAQRSDMIVDPRSSAREAITLGAQQRQPIRAGDRARGPADRPGRRSGDHHDPAVRDQVQHLRTGWRLVLRQPQPRDLRGPRDAAFGERRRDGAGQRGGVLHAALRLPAADPGLEAVDGRAGLGDRLGRLAWQGHHLAAALPAVLRRRPGLGARLFREPPRAEGQLRQSLRRQPEGHRPGGAPVPGAREMAGEHAHQRVLRHRQRLLAGHRHRFRRPRRPHAGRLRVRLQ